MASPSEACSPASGVWSLASSGPASAMSCGRSSRTPGVVRCSPHTGQTLNDSRTCATSGPAHCSRSISSAADSPAKMSRRQATALALVVLEAASGSSSIGLSASSRQLGLWSKTSPVAAIGGSMPCVGAWSSADTKRYRSRCRRKMSELRISGGESSLLPTPSANSYGTNLGGAAGRTGKPRPSLDTMARHDLWPTPLTERGGGNLIVAVGRLHATPCQSDARRCQLRTGVGGPLNPRWVEWLMGFPIGHLSCEPSVTPSCRSARKSSARSSTS